MKAAENDQVKTRVDLRSDFSDRAIPAGAVGTVVECYRDPEAYAVDLSIPDDTLVGGFLCENVDLLPDQFDVLK